MKKIIGLLFIVFLSACSTVTTQEVPKYELRKSESVPLMEEDYFEKVQSANGGTSSDESNSNQTNNEQGVDNNSSESNTGAVQGTRKVKVTRVIDGDTIAYIDHSIDPDKEVTGRLIGINSPEWTSKKQAYGDTSGEFLSNLILGQTIEIMGDPQADEMDRYGRYLIHAFIGKRSIQQILLMEGLTRVAYLYSDYKYIDIYKEAESIAKQEGLNIWSIPGYVDSKNGFNMDVITEDIANELTGELKDEVSDKLLEKISELQKLIK